MKGFDLTQEAIQALYAAHRSAKQRKKVTAAYKINAVILLGTGWTLEDVSDALLLDEDTLASYVKKYHQKGFGGLLETLHKGSQKKLTDAQLATLCGELNNVIHLTTKSINVFVKQTVDITYTVGHL